MKCEICGAPATVHICELNGNSTTNRSFCAAHAQEHLGVPVPSEAYFTQEQVADDSIPLGPDHPSIARLLDLMMDEALQLGVPSIEMDVTQSGTSVRFEVDGDLIERDFLMPRVYAALLARIKRLETRNILEFRGRRAEVEYRSDGGARLRPVSSPQAPPSS